jgi:ribosomal protein S18 acetylase RimI-like enzyme
MGPVLVFTPATATDGEFLYRLTEQTMRGYVEAVWGNWNEQMVREFTDKAARDGSFELISQNGVNVGAMRVERFPDHIRLDQLYVATPYQRRGIGTEIVRNLMAEARAAKQPLRLRVLKTNPAKTLYERLGFVVTETTNERYYMECSRVTLGGMDGHESQFIQKCEPPAA